MSLVKPMGGSEIAFNTLISKLDPSWGNSINLMLSSCDKSLIDSSRINIVWQQLNWNEENVVQMSDDEFVNNIDYFAWVSHWQYDRFRNAFNVPAFKSIVLKNATHPVSFEERSTNGKLKLIYTSTPWRGLDIVLDAFRMLDRDDVELDVFSSTKIYGPNFEKITEGQFDWLFDIAKNMKNVNYHGYATNDVVREYVKNAHIFAYPSTFEETSCISAIEALISGCKVVTTNYGALYETCGDWADYVTYGPNREMLAARYATALNNAINNYWTEKTQSHIRAQNEHYNRFWTWDVRVKEWEDFFQSIKNS